MKINLFKGKKGVVAKGLEMFTTLIIFGIALFFFFFYMPGGGDINEIKEGYNQEIIITEEFNRFLRMPLSAFDQSDLSTDSRNILKAISTQFPDPIVADVFMFRKTESNDDERDAFKSIIESLFHQDPFFSREDNVRQFTIPLDVDYNAAYNYRISRADCRKEVKIMSVFLPNVYSTIFPRENIRIIYCLKEQ